MKKVIAYSLLLVCGLVLSGCGKPAPAKTETEEKPPLTIYKVQDTHIKTIESETIVH